MLVFGFGGVSPFPLFVVPATRSLRAGRALVIVSWSVGRSTCSLGCVRFNLCHREFCASVHRWYSIARRSCAPLV